MSETAATETDSQFSWSAALWPGICMSLICLLLTLVSHGIPPLLIDLLNTLSGHHCTEAISSLANGFHYQVSNNDMPTEAFLVLYAILCLLSVWPLSRLARCKSSDDSRPSESSRPQTPFSRCLHSPLLLILSFSALFRIILLFSVPIHESDFYRYLWDGKVAIHGINPYRFEPGALKIQEQNLTTPFEDPDTGLSWQGRTFSSEEEAWLKQFKLLRDENPVLHARVSHQAVPTVYPPVAQLVFAISSFLFGDSLIGLKLILLIFDALVIAVTLAILRQVKLSPCWIIVYAWSPLVLKEFANSAHYDSVPLCFTLLSIYAALRNRKPKEIAISLALGTLSKFYSAILLPILIPIRKSHWHQCALFAAILLAAYLPFFLWNSTGVTQVFAGLSVYNEHWMYNAGLFALLHQAISLIPVPWSYSLLPAKVITALLLLVVLGYQYFRPADTSNPKLDLVRRCFTVIAALFVLSPTAFPWYYTWLMPFLCIFPKRPWILLSWLLPLSYLDFHNDLAISRSLFLNIPTLSWIIWITFALLIIIDSKNTPKPGKLLTPKS